MTPACECTLTCNRTFRQALFVLINFGFLYCLYIRVCVCVTIYLCKRIFVPVSVYRMKVKRAVQQWGSCLLSSHGSQFIHLSFLLNSN